MNDPFDLPVAGLDTLPVPVPAADFWTRLHDDLVAADAEQRHTTESPVFDDLHDLHEAHRIQVHDLAAVRERRHRRSLAAAAVLVIVVAGLVAVRMARSGEQLPADRTDVVITDPQGIDLDGLRRDALGWEPDPSGPYEIFDLSSLDPSQWTIREGGYDIRDTRATWDWRWTASITRPSGFDGYQLTVTSPESGVVALPTIGDAVEVRGSTGVVGGAGSQPDTLTWIEDGRLVTLHWSAAELDASAGDTTENTAAVVAAAVEFADDLRPIEADDLGAPLDLLPDTVRPLTPPLAGRIDGRDWWIDTALDVDGITQFAIVVDGVAIGSGGGPTDDQPMTLESNIPYAAGRFWAGRHPGILRSAIVVLADGTTATLPVRVDGTSSTWAVPVPIGLDVTEIRLVAANGTVARSITVPVYLDLPGTRVTMTD